MHFTAGPPLPANRPPPHYQTDSNKTPILHTTMELRFDSVSSIDGSIGCTAVVLHTRTCSCCHFADGSDLPHNATSSPRRC